MSIRTSVRVGPHRGQPAPAWPGPLRPPDAQTAWEMRQAFARVGFTEDRLAELERARPVRTTESAGSTTLVEKDLGTLVDLLVHGLPVPRRDAARALAPTGLSQIEATGLLICPGGGDEVSGTATLTPRQGLWVASDDMLEGLKDLRADTVLGVGPATVSVSRCTLRRRARTALDLGAGSGWQSLLASRHCDRVVGVDVNPRALNFAAFNAALNGAVNIELRAGSWFEPVAGELFDLIVCNPPFVISPDETFLFRDTGPAGHALVGQIVRGAAAHLREGGVATVMASWAHGAGEHWSTRPRAWVAGVAADAVLLRLDTVAPADYAKAFSRGASEEASAGTLERWMAYYRDLGVGAVSIGMVVLRRRAARTHWVRTERLRGRADEWVAPQLERLLIAQDVLADRDWERRLRESRLRVVPELGLHPARASANSTAEGTDFLLRLAGGLGTLASVRPAALTLLRCCDGSVRLDELVDRIAPTMEGATARAAIRLVNAARRLLDLGFVEMVEDERR